MFTFATRTGSLNDLSAGSPRRRGWASVLVQGAQKSLVALALCVSAGSFAVTANAQDADPSTQVQTEFAPGVVTEIPPAPDPKETFDGPLTLKSFIESHPEITWQSDKHPDGVPHFDPRSRTLEEMAKQVILRREIFCFEFSFKPLRQMYLDVPRPDGRLQRKLVHYMVYRVRYRGGDLRPAVDDPDNPIYQRIESVSYSSRRFFPMLVLKDHESDR
ncbi:MAG: hypothetical protein ACF8AM_23430, partial [Rhodopirellula sp. JB055]